MLPACCVRELQTAWFPNMTDAGLDRLIELYTALDKPEEAAKWRAERAKYPSEKK